MTDENTHTNQQSNGELELPQAARTFEDVIAAMLSAVQARNIFGTPFQKGETLIIPVSEFVSFLGMGYGSGKSKEQDESGNKQERDEGGGGGGGGKVFSRPVAVVVVAPDNEVRVEPVVDATKIALASLTATGFILGMLLRMLSGRRALKELKDLKRCG